jgi:hypothetical protein
MLIGEVYINCVLSVWWLQVVEATYSNQELAESHFMDGNAVVARRLYQERYPGRRCPDRKIICKYPLLALWTWEFCTSCCQQGTTKISEEDILDVANETPGISTRRASARGCRSCDCLESSARTAAVTPPSAACTCLVTTSLPWTSNALPVVLTTMWYKS